MKKTIILLLVLLPLMGAMGKDPLKIRINRYVVADKTTDYVGSKFVTKYDWGESQTVNLLAVFDTEKSFLAINNVAKSHYRITGTEGVKEGYDDDGDKIIEILEEWASDKGVEL